MRREERCQRIREGILTLCPALAGASGVLRPALGSSAQQGQGHPAAGPAEGGRDKGSIFLMRELFKAEKGPHPCLSGPGQWGMGRD